MTMEREKPHRFVVAALAVLVLAAHNVVTCSAGETQSLIRFKGSLSNATALSNWDSSSDSPCNGNKTDWAGVSCLNGNVWQLRLDGMGLGGLIDVDSLTQLSSLRVLSIKGNGFEGPMPEVKKLPALKMLMMSSNQFTGDIPDDKFDGMKALRMVYLDGNGFFGPIPKSLVNLPRLVNLSLEANQMGGKIPDFRQMELQMVNLANNQFEGKIPPGLSKMSPSYFKGNKHLCGKPLSPCKSFKKMLFITVGVAVALVALVVIGIVMYRKKSNFHGTHHLKPERGFGAYDAGLRDAQINDQQPQMKKRGGDHQGKLVFVRSDRERFELQDLLRASAEVLGSGSFGSSYKAALLGGPAVVVRRFRQMNNVGKEGFYEHMRRLGSLSHPNLLSLVAFFYRKEEKLLISDFVENGSLASHLHANRSPGQPGLDWPTRLKIIKGVTKGLEYLYKELPGLSLPHGHLKSSNVLLDRNFTPLLTDYGLVPVINKDHAQQFMVAFKSPEFNHSDCTTRKTDVWSLGILILEIITGKFPANYLKQGKGANADLATWVNSVVREEWTGEVFDKDMRGTKNGEGEMLKLLKIGMCCCEWNVERRWSLREAMDRIEELRERDSDEEYSSSASEGDLYSSRATTVEDFSFSVTH
ncbi:probable LRR receptor-like serine/threonine-protein kinase At4g31250 [Syzygium oleosum]|uniref:probable LRR receptor-like serine/threonine-protein kinase At4g31250 n=1 Tax=Syzygium oleosum TaxID=219896 RepID=UPI0011D19CEF|nr:probable LRR receptor-like serine/threonine-protein kinase At4g31250 [Syzygium oleosum]